MRLFRRALLVASLMLLIATIALWVRSYQTAGLFLRYAPTSVVAIAFKDGYFSLGMYAGAYTHIFTRSFPSITPPIQVIWLYKHWPREPMLVSVAKPGRLGSVALTVDKTHPRVWKLVSSPGQTLARGSIPAWFIAAALSVHPIFIFVWRVWLIKDHRRAHGLCITCGYDLTGNESGVCPECGEAI